MKNKLLMIFSLIFLGCVLFAEDGQGKASTHAPEYKIPEVMPQRTVAGGVAIVGMLDYLGVDIVGIPNSQHKFDSKYDNAARIGLPMKPDMEKIKAIKPDYFISTANLQGALEPQVQTAKIPSVFLKTNTYDEFLKSMEFLGTVYKQEAKASAYINSVQERIEKAKELAKKNKKKLKVLIIFGTPNSMSFATEHSYPGSLIKVLGAENVWTDTKIPSPTAPINLELIKKANPDIILRTSHGSAEQTAKAYEKEFKNKFWSKLKAVKKGRVYDLSNVTFSISGNIHVPEALDDLTKIFYGK